MSPVNVISRSSQVLSPPARARGDSQGRDDGRSSCLGHPTRSFSRGRPRHPAIGRSAPSRRAPGEGARARRSSPAGRRLGIECYPCSRLTLLPMFPVAHAHVCNRRRVDLPNLVPSLRTRLPPHSRGVWRGSGTHGRLEFGLSRRSWGSLAIPTMGQTRDTYDMCGCRQRAARNIQRRRAHASPHYDRP